MADPGSRQSETVHFPFKARVLGFVISLVIRAVSLTLRIRVEDRARILEKLPDHPLLWIFWHNRIFAMPVIYRRWLRSRKGAVLTSASRDGAVIAATMKNFGVSSVRGSSSRRGRAALLELVEWVRDGYDIVVTPDGPRGPRYELQPGTIKVAQTTGSPIFPIRVEYHSAWKLKSWDRFRIPKPFSKVDVFFEPYESIDPEAERDSFEAERIRIQKILNPTDETD